MKNIFRKSLFAAVLISSVIGSGCNKKLDIDPRQSVDVENALNTAADIESALIGGYSIMGRGSLYGNNLVMLPELLVPDYNIDWYGTFRSYSDIYNSSQDKFNAEAARTWASGYEAINVANSVLDAIDIVTDTDDKNRIEGEAYFIRGLMYFEMLRLYSNPDQTKNNNLGIPIVLTPSKNEADASRRDPRSTIDQVYTQIKSDLNAAISGLPGSNEVGRATRWAAMAIMARVHLQLEEYEEARDLASEVIENGPFSLNSGVTSVFYNKNTPESIFEIQQNDQNTAFNSNDGLTTFYGNWPNGVGRADIEINYDFYFDQENENDQRFTELFDFGTAGSPFPTGLYTKKWKDLGQNIPIIRLAEMYLIRAETNERLGTEVGQSPEADIEVIRNRAGLEKIAAPTLDDILWERRLELAFEGFRSHDYKRLKEESAFLPWNDNAYVMPIPEREILANTSLIQNAGY